MTLTLLGCATTSAATHVGAAVEVVDRNSDSFPYFSSAGFGAIIAAYGAFCDLPRNLAGSCDPVRFRSAYSDVGVQIWCSGEAIVGFGAALTGRLMKRDAGPECKVDLSTFAAICPGSVVDDGSEPPKVGASSELIAPMMVAYSDLCTHLPGPRCDLREFRTQFLAISAHVVKDGTVLVSFYPRKDQAPNRAVEYHIDRATLAITSSSADSRP